MFRRSSSNAGFLREGLRIWNRFLNRLGGPHDYHWETTTCEVPFGKKTNIAMMEYPPFLIRSIHRLISVHGFHYFPPVGGEVFQSQFSFFPACTVTWDVDFF